MKLYIFKTRSLGNKWVLDIRNVLQLKKLSTADLVNKILTNIGIQKPNIS